MAPEQVRGLAVDGRTDVFALGCVMYEMLSGTRAFGRPTAADTLSAILNDDPPALTGTSRAVTSGWDHIVRHCLEKDPGERFQSARDVVFALREQASSSEALMSQSGLGLRPEHRPWII